MLKKWFKENGIYLVFALGMMAFVVWYGFFRETGFTAGENKDAPVAEATEVGTIECDKVASCLIVMKMENGESRQLIIPKDWYWVEQVSDYVLNVHYGEDNKVMEIGENVTIVDFKIMYVLNED